MAIADSAERLADETRHRCQGNLRKIIAYWQNESAGQQSKIVYMREDLEAEYGESQLEVLTNELILESLSKRARERAFNLGDLQAVMFFLNHAIIIDIFDDEGTGVAISFEPESFATLNMFLGRCRDLCLDA